MFLCQRFCDCFNTSQSDELFICLMVCEGTQCSHNVYLVVSAQTHENGLLCTRCVITRLSCCPDGDFPRPHSWYHNIQKGFCVNRHRHTHKGKEEMSNTDPTQGQVYIEAKNIAVSLYKNKDKMVSFSVICDSSNQRSLICMSTLKIPRKEKKQTGITEKSALVLSAQNSPSTSHKSDHYCCPCDLL